MSVVANIEVPLRPSSPRRLHRGWWVVLGASLAIIGAGSVTTLAGVLVGPLHREFGWSHPAIGVAMSVNMVAYGLTAPFAAALMDRFGIRRVVAAALTSIAAGAGLMSTVMGAAWQLTLFWGVLVGAGCGSTAMAFAATVAHRWFVSRRGLVTGILTASGVLGQFAFLPLLGAFVVSYQWRVATVAVAGAALVLVPVTWLLLRDHPADVGTRAHGAAEFTPGPVPGSGAVRHVVRVLGRAARLRAFWLLAAVFAICGATTNGILWTHFVPAAHASGMPVTIAASLLTLIGLFNVPGTIVSGWMTDRVAPGRLLAGYFALRASTLVALPALLGPSPGPVLIVTVVVFGLLDVATVPPVIAECRRISGDDGPVAFGWVNTAHQVGAGAMALFGTAARDVAGSYTPAFVAGAVSCVAAALVLSLRRRAEHGDGGRGP